jgi:predicted O-methyltransferase YrrM
LRPDQEHLNASEQARSRYLDQTFGIEDALLCSIRAKAAELNLAGMQVSPSEGRILQSLVQWSGAQKVVEIGLFLGYSTLWMAKGLPPEGKIISLEKNETHYNLAKDFLSASDVASKVDLRLGDAEHAIVDLEKLGPFDFVFIDANKGAYPQYLDWAEKNVKKGGFIVGDNTFLFGLVYGAGPTERWSEKHIEGMKQFNLRLADSSRYQSCLFPTNEGLTVARKLF